MLQWKRETENRENGKPMNTQYASAFTSTPEKLVRDTFFSINDTYQEARKAYDEWTQTSLTVERECPTDKRGYYDQTHPHIPGTRASHSATQRCETTPPAGVREHGQQRHPAR